VAAVAGADVTILAAHRDTHFACGTRGQVTQSTCRRSAARTGAIASPASRWCAGTALPPRNPARPLLALVTCYPFGATEHGPLRFVVWAEAL
jgi:sortase A